MPAEDLRYKLHTTIAKVSDDYGRRQQFNTAIAAVMEPVTPLTKPTPAANKAVRWLKKCWSTPLVWPIAPHACQALWQILRPGTLLWDAAWPQVKTTLVKSELEVMNFVNGKLRGKITVAATAMRAKSTRSSNHGQ